MKNKISIIWVIAVCLLLAAAYTVYTKNRPSVIPQQNTGSGIMAPDFTLKDLKGGNVKLSDYKGKIVIINFWATWCRYCVQEMPELSDLGRQLDKDKDAVILAIDSEEPEKKVQDFVTSRNIDLRVLLDENGEVTQKYTPYGIQGYPTTFIISPDGSFYTYIPGATNKETIMSIVDKIRKGETLK